MCLNWSFNTFPKHIPLCFSYQIVSGPSEQGCGLGALRRPSLALLSCQSDWGREERPTLTPLLLLVCMPRILSETVSGPGTWGQQRVGQRLVFCCSKAEKPCHRVFKLTEPAQRGAMVFVSLMDVSLVNAGLPPQGWTLREHHLSCMGVCAGPKAGREICRLGAQEYF